MAAVENVEWCSQSEAARRLSAAGDVITQQQISRYLERWPEIPRRAGENGQAMQVDFTALRDHRAQNVIVQERAPQNRRDDEGEAAALRLRERQAAAELKELELSRARDELIPRSAVERAITAAATALQQTHRRTRFERAAALAPLKDPRAIAALLDQHDRDTETAFATALTALANPAPPADGAEENEAEEAADDMSAPAAH